MRVPAPVIGPQSSRKRGQGGGHLIQVPPPAPSSYYFFFKVLSRGRHWAMREERAHLWGGRCALPFLRKTPWVRGVQFCTLCPPLVPAQAALLRVPGEFDVAMTCTRQTAFGGSTLKESGAGQEPLSTGLSPSFSTPGDKFSSRIPVFSTGILDPTTRPGRERKLVLAAEHNSPIG